MGSSNEAKKLQNFSESSEGKSITQIGFSNLEQNIYITGNYDINFFTENFIEYPKHPRLPDTKSYIKMSRHKQITEWHFFFAPKTDNFDEIKQNTIDFCEEHYYNDPDDFKEESDTRNEKTVIIYFNDDNKDKFYKYFIEKHNQYMIPFIIFAGKEEENVELREKINILLKASKKDIDFNIFKFLAMNKNIEEILIQLTINLIECASFFNELGDEFKFPKNLIDDKVMENDLNFFRKNFFSFNIIIIGRPGVGKSTFINKMVKVMICKAGRGGECSSRIIKYLHRMLSITFYDTPGISTREKVDEILDLIREKNNELYEARSRIHAVFYIIDGKNARSFMDYEDKMFECLLNEIRLPVYFILTKLSNKEEGDENLPFMIKNFKKITRNLKIDKKYTGENIKKYIFYVNVIGKNLMGLDKLFTKLYEDFRGYIIEETINSDNIERLTQFSLIGTLKTPRDIINHPKHLCEYINFMYRLMARSISSNEKGSTYLSVAFLKQIFNVYGNNQINLEDYKRLIKSKNFSIDSVNQNKKKSFKSWKIFGQSYYYDYRTPAEEEIDYLGFYYIKMLEEEISENDNKLLKYINNLRITMNETIKGLQSIS